MRSSVINNERVSVISVKRDNTNCYNDYGNDEEEKGEKVGGGDSAPLTPTNTPHHTSHTSLTFYPNIISPTTPIARTHNNIIVIFNIFITLNINYSLLFHANQYFLALIETLLLLMNKEMLKSDTYTRALEFLKASLL